MGKSWKFLQKIHKFSTSGKISSPFDVYRVVFTKNL